jgi:hypothetical protein
MKRTGWGLAIVLTLGCVLVALVATRRESATTAEAVVDAPAAEPTAPAPRLPSPTVESRESRRERDRLAHDERVAKIRYAHAARAGAEQVGPCAGPGCARVGEEIRDILDGCREHAPGTTGRLTLTADVLAAPEVGTLVESVNLTGEGASDALRECLVESMYTLDLGVPDQAFGEQVQVFLGGGITLQLDAKSDPALIDATQQLAGYDDKANAAVRDGAYVISQGPIPTDADEGGGDTR